VGLFGSDKRHDENQLPVDISKIKEYPACVIDYKPHATGGGIGLVIRIFDWEGNPIKPKIGKQETLDKSLPYWDDDSGVSRSIAKALFPEIDWENLNEPISIEMPDDLMERWAVAVLKEDTWRSKSDESGGEEEDKFMGRDRKTVAISFLKPLPEKFRGLAEAAHMKAFNRKPAAPMTVGGAAPAPAAGTQTGGKTEAGAANPWG